MVIVAESWHLKEEFVHQATAVMQEQDELVGPTAHENPAWVSHCRFYQSSLNSALVVVVYEWRSREEHERFARVQEVQLADFCAKYCQSVPEIDYWSELPVEVDPTGHS